MCFRALAQLSKASPHDGANQTILVGRRGHRRAKCGYGTDVRVRQPNRRPAPANQLQIKIGLPVLEKKEIPYKTACEGHRVYSGYTVPSLNPIPGGKITN